MTKYRLIALFALSFALLSTSPALAAQKKTTSLKSSASVSAGTLRSSVSFYNKKTTVWSTLAVVLRRSAKVKLSVKACRHVAGSCIGRSRSTGAVVRPGGKRLKVGRNFARSQRVLVTVRVKGRTIARQTLYREEGIRAGIASDDEAEVVDGGDSASEDGDSSSNANSPTSPGGSNPSPPVYTNPFCLGYSYEPELGYELCSHWTKTVPLPDFTKQYWLPGAKVTVEARRPGGTLAASGNQILVRSILEITVPASYQMTIVATVCDGDAGFTCSRPGETMHPVNLSPGSHRIVFDNLLSTPNRPTSASVVLRSSAGIDFVSADQRLTGCRGNVRGCATPVS